MLWINSSKFSLHDRERWNNDIHLQATAEKCFSELASLTLTLHVKPLSSVKDSTQETGML